MVLTRIDLRLGIAINFQSSLDQSLILLSPVKCVVCIVMQLWIHGSLEDRAESFFGEIESIYSMEVHIFNIAFCTYHTLSKLDALDCEYLYIIASNNKQYVFNQTLISKHLAEKCKMYLKAASN